MYADEMDNTPMKWESYKIDLHLSRGRLTKDIQNLFVILKK